MHEQVAERTIGGYLESLAGTDAMPGGGSAAGVVAALAAGTAELMASLTREPTEPLLEAKAKLSDLREKALQCALDDEKSYGGYLEALGLPKTTDEEKSVRKARLRETMEASARVPLALAVVAVEIVDALEQVILDGNKTVLGDAQAALVMAQAALDVCKINVEANLPYIKDEVLEDDLRTSIEAASEMIVHLSSKRRAQIADRITE